MMQKKRPLSTRFVPGIVLLSCVLAVGLHSAWAAVDLTDYFPLEAGSWWGYDLYQYDSSGWSVLSGQYSVVGTKDMGGGTIASALMDPGGMIQWMGWSSTGLLLFGEEMPDEWSSSLRRPLYYVNNSMEVGSTCSGDSIIDLFWEPQHTFYGTANESMSYTLLAVTDVTLPAGEFLDCAVFLYEDIWSGSGEFYYEKGLMVLAPGVGPVFSKVFQASSVQGVVDWAIIIAVLSDYSIAPP